MYNSILLSHIFTLILWYVIFLTDKNAYSYLHWDVGKIEIIQFICTVVKKKKFFGQIKYF